MKTFEIKGFWGFVFFTLASLILLTVLVTLPITFVWIAWNALVGEIMKGPMIEFWQAIILTAAIALGFQIIFQPQISFQVKRVKDPNALDKHLRKLKEQDSSKDS